MPIPSYDDGGNHEHQLQDCNSLSGRPSRCCAHEERECDANDGENSDDQECTG